MINVDLKECDHLEGASNFTLWKSTLQMLLEAVDLWSFVKMKVVAPIDVALLVKHNKTVGQGECESFFI
jgi:hypothetical protein